MKYTILTIGLKRLLAISLLFSLTSCIKKQSVKRIESIPKDWREPKYLDVKDGWIFINKGEVSKFGAACISPQDAEIVISNQNLCESTRVQILRHLDSINSYPKDQNSTADK